jgi:glycosyltransferase involved in cell wall biosynthesis
MHILLIHQAFAAINEPGGTRHHEIARVLAQRGHQVTIITSPVSYLTGDTGTRTNRWVSREEPDPGITILRTFTYSGLHRSFVHRVFSFLSFMFSSFFVGLGVKNVTHIWGTSPPIFQGWTAWMLARLKGVPFIFEVRDLWPAFAIAVGVLKSKILIHLSEWLEKFLYRHADEMVVNSPGFIKHISSRGARHITLVENGVDVSMFTTDENGADFRKKHNLEDCFVVLYAGAHGLSNNLTVLLDAAKITLPNPKIKYLFVGDGKEKSSLIARAENEGLINVCFIPSVPKNEMGAVLAAADACVAILKPIEMYKTTYPNKVFDYMAAAKPVLLMIDGVIREVVEKAGCGVFIEPSDSAVLAETALRFSQDKRTLNKMGMQGRQFVEQNFNRTRLAEKMETVLLSTNRRRS